MSTPPQSRVAFASLIGTTIEFYDFYIYAMATALVIGKIYFPNSDPTAQSLNALLTFGIAFIARPIGAIIFGHIGDQYGRKITLSASLMLMGGATFMIGALPSYESIGIAAPILLCMLRFAQGLGLGGEWGGAALMATEHAPSGKKAWYGMFPQLGPSIGFLLATLTFLALSYWMNESTFNEWGWRLPFLASAALMLVGLYIRLKIAETPAFAKALTEKSTHKMPIKPLLKQHLRPLLLGGFSIIICYHLFYTATVFCLNYGTHTLQIPRTTFLVMLCIAVMGMMITTPISAVLADKYGRRPILIISGLLALLLGFALPDMLANPNIIVISIFLFFALSLMGATYAPLGAFLPEQFPVTVRYTGAGLAYQLGGILGASLAPLISQWLVTQGGLTWVGCYMSGAALVSICAIWFMQETQSIKPY
jgi:metabolite-proton symporter